MCDILSFYIETENVIERENVCKRECVTERENVCKRETVTESV